MRNGTTGRLRWIALGAAFAAALGLVSWGLYYAAEHSELPYVTVPLDLIPQLDERLPPMRARRASEYRVLFLGDSLAIDTKGADTSIPVRLGQELTEVQPAGVAVEIVAYTGPGLGLCPGVHGGKLLAGRLQRSLAADPLGGRVFHRMALKAQVGPPELKGRPDGDSP